MSFLKTLGNVLKTVLGVITGYGALVTPYLPVGKVKDVASEAVSDLTAISQIIVNVEAVGASAGLSGLQKLEAAAPQVEKVITGWLGTLGLKIDDTAVADYTTAIQAIVNGIVTILNLAKKK